MWFLPVLLLLGSALTVWFTRRMRSPSMVHRLRESSSDEDLQRLAAPRFGLLGNLVGGVLCVVGVASSAVNDLVVGWAWLCALAVTVWAATEQMTTAASLRRQLGLTIGELQRRREKTSVRFGVAGIASMLACQLLLAFAPRNGVVAAAAAALLLGAVICLIAVAWTSIWVFRTTARQ